MNNIASTALALTVTNSATDATFTYTDAAIEGTADSATLTLKGQTAGTDVIAGIETLNIVSSDSPNALTALTAADATTIAISGDQTLNLGSANTVATTITSTNTAGVTLVSNHAAKAVKITTGAGKDSITFTEGAAKDNSVDAGAGNDTITFTANLANTDTVVGGDGTDTLVATSSNLNYTKPTTATISGIEVVKVSNALANDVTLSSLQAGIKTAELAAEFQQF